ncbi:polysaccharide pyruvyl transferase family protein [Anaerocolumna xylanovorans]|uniref:Coenzyme F420-reducing hydrogenase, beta subunit n=1 Tax=Anaerocolumna xylanovorans DSM 12503 TaxID=1121345 RepID=A0A1M7YIB7_9FIRM|nr:polysaccharide pyruvyl transferase family protein [Anaerocolumna xylanovorans]SHO52353.1 Coenzyme F420-reducing hydrogenase, beta subunit [Anaerocolumna xylanovorans DSM 12503]
MKIGIITFNSAHNYGAVLQAWALQEYLKSEGHQVKIINYRLPATDNLYKLYQPRNPFKHEKLNEAVHALQYLKKMKTEPNRTRKYREFERFINRTLNTTKPISKLAELKKINFDYDIMIAGSDQIWNGGLTRGINPAYLLAFGKDETKRISYAASIGRDEIPEVEHTLFARYLRDFDYISVREEKAKEAISKLTDKEVTVVLDPTLLLEREMYDKLKKDPKVKQDYIYVHNVHIKKVDKRLNAMAEEMSKRTGLPIVHNREDYDFTNELKKFTNGSPEEFVGYIANAKYVIANSFHGTVFSIIYQRDFITVPHFQNPERMRHLLGSLGIVNHMIATPDELPEDLAELNIDYDAVEKARLTLRGESVGFLKNAIEGPKTSNRPITENDKYFDTKDIYSCFGCNTCRDICPTSAITMIEDKEGFKYPVIDEEKCIHCNMCRKVCPYGKYKHKEETVNIFPKVYAAMHKSDEVLEQSASGGMFTAMYKNIIARGGKAVGVKYTDNMEVIYDIAETEEECQAFRGSKYVFADSSEVKPRVKELLREGVPVLYSGNPCQIAGLKNYLRKDYDNLYTVEIICHAAASPKVFRLYNEYLENLYHSKIIDFEFRNKIRGWSKPYLCVKFESGEVLLEQSSRNNFRRAFSDDNIQRPCCYTCEFASPKLGVGDITIGDYWGIAKQHPEMADEKGVSIIKINNEHGLMFFEEFRDQFNLTESTYEKAYAANHNKPIPLTIKRNQLMSQIDDVEINKLLQNFNRLKKNLK